jgi:hypothetical protein
VSATSPAPAAGSGRPRPAGMASVAAVDTPAPAADVLADVEPASGSEALLRRLEVPEEPTELRDRLRLAVLDDGGWHHGVGDDHSVDTWLWSRWQAVLEPAGMARQEFGDIVASTRREQWLWLHGDRRWEQYASGLAGRVARRAPGAGA